MVSIEGRDAGFVRLPHVLKILCENVARHQPEECDAFRSWLEGGGSTDAEVHFYPSRVLTHDTTCVRPRRPGFIARCRWAGAILLVNLDSV
jgi:aconitase A